MKRPNLQVEKELWKKGYKYVVCLDEVGRGALCGPVVAAAVMIKNHKSQITNSKQIQNTKYKIPKSVLNFGHLDLAIVCDLEFGIWNLKLRDSKKLSPKARNKFYKILTSHPSIKWGTGRVYPRVIDRVNIFEATKLAMERAINNLKFKITNHKLQTNSKFKIPNYKPDFLVLDGKMKLDLPIAQKAIVKADEKVFSCAAASIIAKVQRDRLMRKYHKKYPGYGFDRHKGYGTKEHIKALKKLGLCDIHRDSFKPLDALS